MRQLDRLAVERIAKGACFLGSGGGGPYSITPDIITNIFKLTDSVKVVDISEVPDDAYLAIAAGMGSPQGSQGMTFDTAGTVAFERLEKICGQTLSYVAAIEVGAGNSLVPMLVATQKNIPLIDANGAGRAVPTLPLTTYNQAGLAASPAVLAAVGVPGNPGKHCPAGNNAQQVEDWAGNLLTTDPDFTRYHAGAIALWAFSGKDLKTGTDKDATAIGGSLLLAEKIGAALETKTPIESVQTTLNNYPYPHELLGCGKVIAVKEEAVGALDGGTVIVDMGSYLLELPYLNEFLGAFIWDTPHPRYVLGPDMICCMTPAGEPLSNPSINEKFKQSGPFEMVIFILEAVPAMRKPAVFEQFAASITRLYPAFNGGFQKSATLTMEWHSPHSTPDDKR